MMNKTNDSFLQVLKDCSKYSQEAQEIVGRLLSNSSTTTGDLGVENENILSSIRDIAVKNNFTLPEEPKDKDALINSLLKLVMVMDSKNQSALENISAADDDEFYDGQSVFSDEDAEDDLLIANIREQFSNYLLANRFADVMFQYSNPEFWRTYKPKFRKIYATMLIDEARQHSLDYPDFWHNYID